MNTKLYTHYRKILADTITSVSIYLKLRDKFPHSLLLESSDYHTNKNSFSYICCNPIAFVKIQNKNIEIGYPDGTITRKSIDDKTDVTGEIQGFADSFETDKNNFHFANNGLFGYMSYDAVQYFEQIQIKNKPNRIDIPDVYYAVYQNLVAVDHFKNEAYIFCHSTDPQVHNIDEIEQILNVKNFTSHRFEPVGSPKSLLTDEEFVAHIKKAKQHCQRGDVFQLVLSRRFSQRFKGDEFNAYRALRSINPSPYLFFFDYGDFKVFGSSPEAQLVIQDGQAEIHPIAGTFRRTGDDIHDANEAERLSRDKKENAEHVMLVDLARNDLSRSGTNVKVDNYKEVQFFSHVIHLVSKVVSEISPENKMMTVVADTFPAGTLSGAPKHKAMQLIDKYEVCNRGFYGGAIGFMDFNGNFNHAIIIRTFLSKDHHLYFQAGAGIVSESDVSNELQEVYNKLGALQKALEVSKYIL